MAQELYEFERYMCTVDTVRERLEAYGVAIIPSVLNGEECDAMVAGMWDTLEHWTQDWPIQIHRDNPASWRLFQDLFPTRHMLLQHYKVGHAQFVWDLRQNWRIVAIFAALWNCDPRDLLVSFDGASFHMPSETTRIGWSQKGGNDLHTDQSYTRNGFECVQSWVTGFDVNPGDATLQFLEGSHHFHEDFARHFGVTERANWYMMEKEDSAGHLDFYLQRGCQRRFIQCPRGSLVLWDSRLIHCGTRPMRWREQANFRCVVYLCYQPRTGARPRDLRKKREAFERLRMTSHWPCRPKLFAEGFRNYGKDVKGVRELNPPVLAELGERFAGF
jgi:hypothetical protein